jgi:cytochrome c biogenesis protein CcmG/thiol:disulfide interchange protein DsbE
MWKFLIPMAAFVGLVVLFALGLNPNRDIRALPSPLIGKPAPAIALTDVMDPSRARDQRGLSGPGIHRECLGHVVRDVP